MALGCVSEERRARFERKRDALDRAKLLASLKVSPSEANLRGVKVNMDGVPRMHFRATRAPGQYNGDDFGGAFPS